MKYSKDLCICEGWFVGGMKPINSNIEIEIRNNTKIQISNFKMF